ncbi:SDR family oxidoreductase [Mycolicibacterium neoaurum]|uniref:Nucleoside-diphosphate sugar epimerase n=1 Tax=Mycolicibacterium neoaurum TaxID=1795 RepID=A0AAV2WJA4_MYCNE|nr:NAD(P)H-binding protein [Mycolicibacterium neoaurum]TLH61355.1 hydroxylase [Mycolicibacterium neoaurum]CDQ44304.1 putative nucleoside-diphosphate sugar epimerase [Mycolicibacterium neoaurum]
MTILVTGATGNIGRQVVAELIALGVNDIRALTVNPTKAALPDSVTAVTGYLGKPDSLPAALNGVERVYLAPHPPTLAATLEHLTNAGVRYVVALTGGAHWQQHADAVTASGLGQTQLGPGEFSDNFTMWAPQIRTGVVHDIAPDAVQSPVSMRDIARVAAHLLADPQDSHLGKMYELTGPRALTRAEIAREIGIGVGIDVEMRRCSRAEADALLRPLMGDGVDWYLDLFDRAADPQGAEEQFARDQIVTGQPANDHVERLTGIPAESMAQWAARNREVFV